jgi:hypothetical protein
MKVRRRVRPGAFKPRLRKLAFPAVAALTFALVLAAAAGGVTADATAPTLTLTSPVAGTVSGSVPLAANASDASGTPAVLFKVDGKPAGTPWDTTAVANGSHIVTATATDAAGDMAQVAATVDVENAGPPPPPPPPPTTVSVRKIFEGSDSDRQAHYFAVTAAVPAGDTILLAHASTVDATDGSGGILAVRDTHGNAWRADAVSHLGRAFTTVEIWGAYVTTPLSAGDTIEVDGYARGLSDEIAIYDVSGLASNRVDQTAGSEAYSQTQTTPTVTTTQAHELLVGIHGQSHAGAPWWTPDGVSPAWTKWTDRFDGGNISEGLAVVMREVTAIGSYRSSGHDPNSQTQNNLLVTYRAAS